MADQSCTKLEVTFFILGMLHPTGQLHYVIR
jgi:hypothetical protein